MLYAQQLYFIRATAEPEYGFYELPPVQIIACIPEQDTVLQVYKDYTDVLNQRLKRLEYLTYYPKFEMFYFSIFSSNEFFLMKINQPDTLIEIKLQCPPNYERPSYLEIINDYWGYECFNNNAMEKKDVFLFKGVDFSLTQHFDLAASDFKNLHLTGVIKQRVSLKPNDERMYLPIVADMENRPPFSVVAASKVLGR